MWRKRNQINSTKVYLLEEYFKADLKDAKHAIVKIEYHKPIKGSEYRQKRCLYNDSILYSSKLSKQYYCFTETEIKSKDMTASLPWESILSGNTITNDGEVPLRDFYYKTLPTITLNRVQFRGRFYYIANH